MICIVAVECEILFPIRLICVNIWAAFNNTAWECSGYYRK